MALKDILRRVMAESGFNTPDLNTAQRPYLIDKINEACEEIWEAKDLPVSLKECCVRATADRQLALPGFVGELRAIRQGCDDTINLNARMSLKDIRSKHVETEWKRLWNNWRIIGESPICIELTETAPGTIDIEATEDDLTVTITGSTLTSNRASDTITIAATSQAWTKSFTDIVSIRKNKVTESDIVIYDAAGDEMSIIYADQLEARFIIVDISKYPFTGACQCADGSYITEVLYKPRCPRLENDEDVFPLVGYDNVIVLKTKQLLAEEQEGQEVRAVMMHEKAKMKVEQKIQDKTSVTRKGISFGRNPLMSHRRLFRTGSCY
jgi:hypothetical protein